MYGAFSYRKTIRTYRKTITNAQCTEYVGGFRAELCAGRAAREGKGMDSVLLNTRCGMQQVDGPLYLDQWTDGTWSYDLYTDSPWAGGSAK